MRIAVEKFGLVTTDNAQVALRGVRFRSQVSALCHKTIVEQTFVNSEARAIEAVYTFPLPENAAVCNFEIITGDRVLTGVIEETDQATEQYDAAIREGHGAFMLDAERPDVFTVWVGNLKPRQAVTIRLTYVAELEAVDGSIRLSFPTTVAPRYVTSTGTTAIDAAMADEALNPPHVLWTPYGLSMEVALDGDLPVTEVTSPSHSLSIMQQEDGRTLITFSGDVSELDRDVVLNLKLKHTPEPEVIAETGADGANYLAVTFHPEFEPQTETQPAEVCFVLDCSGSMQGDSIEQATRALELCLRSLSAGDQFNVIRFGSTYKMLSQHPLGYDERSLARALAFVSPTADLGGTELMAPLTVALETATYEGDVQNIILLTDGQISNESAVIELARKHRKNNRIFSFGIGHACSAHLVRGLARATGGAAEFITPGERIEEKVLRTFARLASPVISEISIDWGNADVQTLSELPPIFDGDALVVFGRTPGRVPERVTLNCLSPAGAKSWSVKGPHASSEHGQMIPLLWARRVIQSLQEVNDLQRTWRRKKADSREAQELVRISKQFGMPSALTTFVAVEHRSVEERTKGIPKLRRVPVMLAKGWGGVEPMVAGAALARASGTMYRRRGPVPLLAKAMDRTIDRLRDSLAEEFVAPVTPPRMQSMEKPRDNELFIVLSAQNANGGFDRPTTLMEMLKEAGLTMDACGPVLERKLMIGSQEREEVLHACAVMLLLKKQFAGEQRLWKRHAQKALKYLSSKLSMPVDQIEAALASVAAEL